MQIREVRLRGGDVIVSFGGAAGQELAQVVTDEEVLVSAAQHASCLETPSAPHTWTVRASQSATLFTKPRWTELILSVKPAD